MHGRHRGCCARLAMRAWGLILVVGAAVTGGGLAEDRVYVVQKKDTLSRIARHHGLSTAALARYNDLSPQERIYPGQRLLIPANNAPSYRLALPTAVRSAIDNAKVRPGRWRYIVIHHSATDVGSVKALDTYHRRVRQMENGLAYHFVIGNGQGMGDGQIAVGPRWTQQLDGGHLATDELNHVSLGICLVGNFDQKKPTRKQMASLKALVLALLDRCKLTPQAVKTHQQINPVHTRCPGRYFPTDAFHKDLKARS